MPYQMDWDNTDAEALVVGSKERVEIDFAELKVLNSNKRNLLYSVYKHALVANKKVVFIYSTPDLLAALHDAGFPELGIELRASGGL